MLKNRFFHFAVLLTLASSLTVYGCTTPRGDDDDDDSGPELEGDDPGECSDGADNDADGAFDCDDSDCAGAPDCQGDDDDAGHGDDDDGGHGDDDDGGHGDDDDGGHGDDDDGGHGSDDDDGGHGSDDDDGGGDDDDGGGSTVSQGFGVTWTEVVRSENVGGGGVTYEAFSSWFGHTTIGWPQGGTTDNCVSGSGSNLFIPGQSDQDVGTPSFELNGSGEGSLSDNGDYFDGSLNGTNYAEGVDFDIAVSGGSTVGATSWPDTVDMPDNLSASSNATVNGTDGLTVTWDTNNGPDLQIRVINDASTFTWVVCQVADDGEFVIGPTDLAPWPAGNATVEIRSEEPAVFTVLAGVADGVGVGVTQVTQDVNMPAF
ncbi:MAG: hypothetical protein KDA24_21975 [Deltaproteobacteria bacterium]|nr:hypothetical protein [Deltaproteobacteria bacterium]